MRKLHNTMTKSITLKYTIAVLAAFVVVLAYAGIADAAVNSSNIRVEVKNNGTINNTTSAKAHTGENYAEGSFGGDGGTGGDVTASGVGDYNNGGAEAGNGGNGGGAGPGGLVNTGDATADAGTENSLNGTDVEIDLTNAMSTGEDMNSTYIGVDVKNGTKDCECTSEINNTTRARARTGENYAEGSFGGDGDDGGDVTAGSGDYNNGGAEAGNGGHGGTSDLGGEVKTGKAVSEAGTINLLNTTLIKVKL